MTKKNVFGPAEMMSRSNNAARANDQNEFSKMSLEEKSLPTSVI